MSDPYRGSSALPCARCRESLERSPGGYDCPRGHGLWDAGKALHGAMPIAMLGSRVATQLHCGRCPTCRTTMELRRWEGVTFEVCAKHGVWVAAEDADEWLERTGGSRSRT